MAHALTLCYLPMLCSGQGGRLAKTTTTACVIFINKNFSPPRANLSRLILARAQIMHSNHIFHRRFGGAMRIHKTLSLSSINTPLEFDTVGKSNLLYQGNGVVEIRFSRQSTLRVGQLVCSRFHE